MNKVGRKCSCSCLIMEKTNWQHYLDKRSDMSFEMKFGLGSVISSQNRGWRQLKAFEKLLFVANATASASRSPGFKAFGRR